MKFQFQFALLLTVSTFILSLPFIAKSKSALSNMRGGIGKLKSILDTMDQKIKTLDSDFSSLGKNFKVSERNWYKYKEHCYYYSEDLTDWFTAENNCRKIDGYLVKFDEKAENEAISSHRPLKMIVDRKLINFVCCRSLPDRDIDLNNQHRIMDHVKKQISCFFKKIKAIREPKTADWSPIKCC